MFRNLLLCAGLEAGVKPSGASVLEQEGFYPVKKSFRSCQAGGGCVLHRLRMVERCPGRGCLGQDHQQCQFLSFSLSFRSSHSHPQRETSRNPTNEGSGYRGLAPGSASHWLVTLVKHPLLALVSSSVKGGSLVAGKWGGSSLSIEIGLLSSTFPGAGHMSAPTPSRPWIVQD